VAEHLFTVEHVFTVPHQGVYLGPGLGGTGFRVRVGDPLELRKPDGSSAGTTIRGIAAFSTSSPADPCRWLICLPPEWEVGEIPIGTEVWTAP